MNRTFCKTIFSLTLMALAVPASPFSWPAKNLDPAKSVFTFAQNRQGRFCQSLVFQNAQGANSTDKGKIIVVLTERQGDGDWFESPLGNALILSHDDSLISVYGNLTKQSANGLLQKSSLGDEEFLGETGDSSWSDGQEGGELEFQIADTSSKTFINPNILMPRTIKPPKVALEGLALENQFGRLYNMAALRSVPAGVYKIYKKRQQNITVFKSELYVNGAEVEKITKETLKANDGKLALSGQRLYTSGEFYPNEELEFLGHILLPHGNDTITVSAADILENTVTATFTISGY